jgi:hypothetical protein
MIPALPLQKDRQEKAIGQDERGDAMIVHMNETTVRRITVTIDPTAAATPVNIVPDSEVHENEKVVILGWKILAGAVAAATITDLKVQTTAMTPTDHITILEAKLTSAAYYETGNTADVILSAEYKADAGADPGYGLQVVGTANGTGSPVTISIRYAFETV